MLPRDRNWWESRQFLIFICALMAVPLIWPTIPPFTDLYGHIGRYKVQLDLHSSPYLQNFYTFDWQLAGNLGVDLLIIPMSKIFGLELGVKLIVMTIPVLAAAGMLWIAYEAHGRLPPTAFFALPLAYNYPFLFGFVNFALSMAVGLIAFGLWIHLERKGKERFRAALFVPIGLAIWLCHAFGWGVLGLLVFGWEVTKRLENKQGILKAIWRGGLACLPLTPPLLLMLIWRADGDGLGRVAWFSAQSKLTWAMRALQDRWVAFDLVSLAMLFFMIFAGLRSEWLGMHRRLGAGALILLVIYLAMPWMLFSSAYADMRLFPYVLIVALIALAPKADAAQRIVQIAAIAALLFLGARIATQTASFALYSSRHNAALAALDYVPRGAKLISFANQPCGPVWPTARQTHLPALAIVRREAFSNDQWLLAGSQLLSVKKNDAVGFNYDPSQIVNPPECLGKDVTRTLNQALATFPRSAFDYVWLIDPQGLDPKLLQGTTRIWTNGTDALYRIDRQNSL
jgi:hypothetical protein